MLFGGGSGGQQQQQQAPQQGGYDQGGAAPAGGGTYGQQQAAQPCEGEMANFLQCSLNVEDLNDCLAYKQQLAQCQEQMRNQYMSA